MTGLALSERERVLAPNVCLVSAIAEYLTMIAGRIFTPGNLTVGEQLGVGHDKMAYKGTIKTLQVTILKLRSAVLTDAEVAMFVRLGHHPH